MKNFIAFSAFVVCCAGVAPLALAEAETKKVCTKQMDAKTKKEKEVCKTIKIHKKLEGTKIPDGKK
jgi:hypothetical protein